MVKLGVFGPQGSGKTTISMLLCRYFQQFDPEIKIYTNVNATGKNLVTINDLAAIPFQDGKPKIFYLDEAMFTLDSRNSSSRQNKIWTKAFALFRKSDFILEIYSTHTISMLDVRVRDQLNYVIMSRKNSTHFDYILYDTLSKMYSPIQIPKTKEIFDFANFNTKDFPDPILIDELQKIPLFALQK